jgi:hypothetical protein
VRRNRAATQRLDFDAYEQATYKAIVQRAVLKMAEEYGVLNEAA